jgi:hypothetical protein
VQLHPSLEKDAALVLVRLDEHAKVVRIVLTDAKEDRRIIGGEGVYLDYQYGTSPPGWITLCPYRKLSAARRTGFKTVISEWPKDCDNNHSVCKKRLRNTVYQPALSMWVQKLKVDTIYSYTFRAERKATVRRSAPRSYEP